MRDCKLLTGLKTFPDLCRKIIFKMFVAPSELPGHSRIWIYQSNRLLTDEETKQISEKTQSFLESWTAHNNALKGSFEIRYNRFLILMIDEKTAGASGCSIDKSVHFIQSLEKDYGINFFDRMSFAIKNDDSTEILPYKEFEKKLLEGELTDQTIVFNNLVKTKDELENKWEIPLKDSWHKTIVG
jgi:hypothetical protein